MSSKKEKKLAARAARQAAKPAKPFGRGAGLMVEDDATSDEEGEEDDESDDDPLAGVDAETRAAILHARMEGLKDCGDW